MTTAYDNALDEFLGVLDQLHNSSNSEEISTLEHRLKMHAEEQPQPYFNSLVEILLRDGLDDDLRLFICINLNHFVRDQMNGGHLKQSEEFKQIMMKSLAKLILCRQLNTKCKKALTPLLQFFLLMNDDKPYQIIIEQIVGDLNTNLTNLENDISSPSDTQQLIGTLQVLETITHTSSMTKGLQEYYNATVSKFALIGRTTIQQLYNLMKMMAEKLMEQNPGEKIHMIAPIEESVFTVKLWIKSQSNIIERIQTRKQVSTLETYVKSEEYAQILYALLELCVPCTYELPPEEEPIYNSKLFSENNDTQLDNEINFIKLKTLEVLHILLEFLYNTYYREDSIEQTPLGKRSNDIVLLLINDTQKYIQKNPSLEALEENDSDISNTMVEVLQILSLVCTDQTYNKPVNGVSLDLLVNIIFPVLRTTHREKDMLQEQPGQFVSLSLDTCEKQASGIPKTAAAQLLEALNDNFDHCPMMITKFVVEAISIGLAQYLNKDDVLQQLNLEYSTPYAKMPFFANSSPDVIVDTCLVACSILSYAIQNRPDTMSLIDQIVTDITPSILDSDSILMKSRLIMLFSFLFDALYVREQASQIFKNALAFLMESLMSEYKPKLRVLALQATEAIETIFFDPRVNRKIVPYLDDVVGCYAHMISSSRLIIFFSIMQQFIKQNAKRLTHDHVMRLFEELVNRVKNTQQQILDGKAYKSDSQFVRSAANLMNQIITRPKFKAYIPEFKEKMFGLLHLLTQASKLDFEEEIIEIYTFIMRKEKELDQVMIELFPHLEIVFMKNKMEFGNLLEMMNLYTMIGMPALLSHYGQESVKGILTKMIKGALYKIKNDWEMAALESLTLVTAIFFNLQRELAASWIEDFAKLLLGRYKLKPLDNYISAKITLALLSMAYASSDTLISVLNQQRVFPNFMARLNKLKNQIDSSYQRKVYVIGISALYGAKEIPEKLRGETLLELLKNCAAFLTIQKIQENKSIHQVQKDTESDTDEPKKMDADEESDSEEDYEDESQKTQDDDDEFNSSEEDELAKMGKEMIKEENKKKDAASKTMINIESLKETIRKLENGFKSSVKKSDEYKIFRELLFYLKESYPEAMANLEQQLSPKVKKYLMTALKVERVHITVGKEEVPVARKIIHVKRRLINQDQTLQMLGSLTKK